MEKKKRNLLKERQGYTLIELIVVIAVLSILGTMLVSLINTGVQFYRTANTTMDNQSNVRLAIAYITVKIRQNDITNGISVVQPLPLDSTFKVLKVKDASSRSGDAFWIYFDSKTDKLREQSGNTFDQVMENGTEIVDLSCFPIQYYDLVKSGANLHFEVKLSGVSDYFTYDITLRSP